MLLGISFGVVTYEIEIHNCLMPDTVYLMAICCHVKYRNTILHVRITGFFYFKWPDHTFSVIFAFLLILPNKKSILFMQLIFLF